MQSTGHRSDIEGLRGVAVLAVTAVHAWPELLRGGFVGVDIFFVLSGYLITGALYASLQRGGLGLLAFYRRRALRLLPALCTVLLACLLAAAACFPGDARSIGRHIAASSLFATNIALWQEAGYFDAASDFKPLLHLWSLGIEEQFYLLWPLVAALAWRSGSRALVVVLALTALSFALNVIWVVPKAKGTFFLLPTRAWELMLGASLATAQTASIAPSLRGGLSRLLAHATTRQLMAAAGAALITVAFALLHARAVFPGWWALLPTLGTVLLLAAGPGAWINRRVLSHPLLTWYGSISYPLYLWHWPLLVFPLLLGVTMDHAARAVVITAGVALAALTRDLIEQPLRFGARATPRTALALLGALALIGLCGWGLHLSDGLLLRYPSTVREIARADLGFDFGAYRSGRCFLDLEQGPQAFAAECSARAVGSVALWGDSHAASLYPGLADSWPATAAPPPIVQFTKARCPPLLRAPPGASRHCEAVNAHVLAALSSAVPDTVILAGFWLHYLDEGTEAQALLAAIGSTVQQLSRLGVRSVRVVGPLPSWTEPLPRVLLREWRRSGDLPERTTERVDARARPFDRLARSAIESTGATFVSPIDALCDVRACQAVRVIEGVAHPLVHDDSHLTTQGSVELVRRAGLLGPMTTRH